MAPVYRYPDWISCTSVVAMADGDPVDPKAAIDAKCAATNSCKLTLVRLLLLPAR